MDSTLFAALRDVTCSIADRYSIESPDAIDSALRSQIDRALAELGLDAVREPGPDSASVQECVALVEELGARLLCASYLGPAMLAGEARRLLGAGPELSGATIALGPRLEFCAAGTSTDDLIAWDCGDGATALAVLSDGRVIQVRVGDQIETNDLLRRMRRVRAGSEVVPVGRLSPAQLSSWQAFALTLLAGEMVGAARHVVAMAVEYARIREQYGRAIGTFQSVAHLLADAHVEVESATSITRYAAWSCDNDDSTAALRSARIAKAYVSQSASDAVQTAMQVIGGMAQTWEHPAHLYLRRVLADGLALAATDDLLFDLAPLEALHA